MTEPATLTYATDTVIYQFQAFGELVLRSDMMVKLGFKTKRQWRAQVQLWEKREETELLTLIAAYHRKQYISRNLVKLIVKSIEGQDVALLFS